mgnify:CR=1 FL=1
MLTNQNKKHKNAHLDAVLHFDPTTGFGGFISGVNALQYIKSIVHIEHSRVFSPDVRNEFLDPDMIPVGDHDAMFVRTRSSVLESRNFVVN